MMVPRYSQPANLANIHHAARPLRTQLSLAEGGESEWAHLPQPPKPDTPTPVVSWSSSEPGFAAIHSWAQLPLS